MLLQNDVKIILHVEQDVGTATLGAQDFSAQEMMPNDADGSPSSPFEKYLPRELDA